MFRSHLSSDVFKLCVSTRRKWHTDGGQRSEVEAQRSGVRMSLGTVGGDVMCVTGVALTETRPLSAHLLTPGCWQFVKLEVEHSGTPTHYVTCWVAVGDRKLGQQDVYK